MPRLIDLSGKVFGRLTVIREDGRDKHGQKLWLCKCECGNETHVRTGNLRSGGTSSCGCLASERINVNGKEVHLGVFEDLKEAAFARKQAELLYWGVAL